METNNGVQYTRPSTVPARSSTVLVTSTGYKADAVQQVALTGSSGTFTLTFGGQTTAAIAYNATAATVQSALQSLSSIGSGNVLVSGPAGGPCRWIVVTAAVRAVCPPALAVHCLLPWRLGLVFRIFKEDWRLSAKKALTNRLAVRCEESECFRA